MNRLYYPFLLNLLFPLASIHSQIDIKRLEIALENASRTGQIIFLEEITWTHVKYLSDREFRDRQSLAKLF